MTSSIRNIHHVSEYKFIVVILNYIIDGYVHGQTESIHRPQNINVQYLCSHNYLVEWNQLLRYQRHQRNSVQLEEKETVPDDVIDHVANLTIFMGNSYARQSGLIALHHPMKLFTNKMLCPSKQTHFYKVGLVHDSAHST